MSQCNSFLLNDKDMEKMYEEFATRWRDRMAGMALMGMILATDHKPEGRMKRASEIMAIPDKVSKILREMFNDALRIWHNHVMNPGGGDDGVAELGDQLPF